MKAAVVVNGSRYEVDVPDGARFVRPRVIFGQDGEVESVSLDAVPVPVALAELRLDELFDDDEDDGP